MAVRMMTAMVWRVALFEFQYHVRRASTYVFAALLFLLPFLDVSLREGTERLLINSPSSIAQMVTLYTALGMLIVASVCGMAVVRDFEGETYQILFATPLRRADYLGGRLVGSLAVLLVIFASSPIGAWTAMLMPWADHEHLGPDRLWPSVQPFLVFTVPTVCFTGALFFAAGALTRSLPVVYLQGVMFLIVNLSIADLMPGNLESYWFALFDPFGIHTLSEATKYWSLAETNTQYVELSGVVLWNRLIWCGVAAMAVAATFGLFPRSAEGLTARRWRRAIASPEDTPFARRPLPSMTARFDRRAVAGQWLTLTRLRFRIVTRDLTFLAILLTTLALELTSGWAAPLVLDTPVYPVTYLLAERLDVILLIVITTIYAGELVWRERTLRFDQIHDALPMPAWLTFTSQLAALTVVQVITLTALVATSIAHQVWLGYYQFELDVYASSVFGVRLSQLVLYSVLGLFLQTIMPNKFVGHLVAAGVFFLADVVLTPLANRWNWTFPIELYAYGSRPGAMYSDMNGYGFAIRALIWHTLYWTAGAGVLAALALRFGRRGTDTGWRARWRMRRWGWAARVATALCVVTFVGIGVTIYRMVRTNARFVPMHVSEARAARYEREFKQYERLPQPKITAIDLRVDLQPALGTFTAEGTYTLKNKTAAPIPAIHVLGNATRQWQRLEVTFDRPGRDLVNDVELRYRIVQLDTPLAPGETMHLYFTVARERPPLDVNVEIVANGTFFADDWFPWIGYQRDAENTSEDRRREHGLPPREDLPPPDDTWGRSRNLFVADADWVSFRATVSTDADQIAVAPGYLEREWVQGSRRYFTYDMGPTPMLKFFTIVSARYAVASDRWNDVDIQVFYDPKHPYNIARMIQATKDGLDYFSTNFGPYQFRQFRVLEFPRYRQFAQSFPNTVPFSEGNAFIGHPAGDDDRDSAYYVTLHELAHQWWAHQAIGGFTAGANVLSEMLAEYSALMVLERNLGPNRLRLYLRHDLDSYLRGRGNESRGEQTLARVTRQPYVWYRKGSLAMYAMKEAIGEERLNAVLRGFLERVRFQDAPYTTVDEFLAELRAATPPDRQSLITDLFERITLFDNRAVNATWRETPDGRYAVTLRATARKLYADANGSEQEVAIDDDVDIGVFAGSGATEHALFLEKRRLTERDATFEIVVDEPPTRAGIDPYNKLIDRVSDDNVVSVSRAGS